MSDDAVQLTTAERRRLLRRAVLFAEAPDPVLDRLAADAEVLSLPAGAVLVRQGADADAVFTLVQGRAEVRVEGGHRDEGTLLHVLEAGDVVGEMGVLMGEVRNATVRCPEPCVVLRVPRLAVLRALEADEALAGRVWTMLVRRRLDGLLAGSRRFQALAPGARDWLAQAVQPLRLDRGEVRALVCPGTLFVVAGSVEADTELGWTSVRGPALLPCIGPVSCWARTDAVVGLAPPLHGLGG